MSKLLLLYLTLIVGLFFLIAPEPIHTYDFFPFSDMKLYPATYVYFICERLTLVILSGIIWNEATEYKPELKVFFYLMCADVVDFLATYNGIWFNLGSIPVSMNTVSATIFGLTILNVWIRTLLK